MSFNVLVTGAWGTLGREVVRALSSAGHHVRCFDRPSRATRRAARRLARDVEVLWGDVRSPSDVARAVAHQQAVVHCAAMLPPLTETQPERAEAVNVGGTHNLVKALGTRHHDVRVVYPSSVSIYGPAAPDQAPWRADDAINPTDAYTRHKAACETLLRGSGLRWLVLRVGVSLDAGTSKVSGDVLRAMFEVSPEARLELVHPADVALAITHALDCDEAWNRVLCIGGGESCRIHYRDLFACGFGAVGLDDLPAPAFGDGAYYTGWLDTEESERLLHYQTHSFAEYRRECRRALRGLRWALAPVRPLARWGLLRYSRPWRERKGH